MEDDCQDLIADFFEDKVQGGFPDSDCEYARQQSAGANEQHRRRGHVHECQNGHGQEQGQGLSARAGAGAGAGALRNACSLNHA